MIKLWYTGFIEHDVTLYNVEAGKHLAVQNLSMHEEMGQINYLFCDKTGTLTKNLLIFREMAVIDSNESIMSSSTRAKELLNNTEGDKSSVATADAALARSKWRFKKLPPSETLFNLIRCILICHDVLKINNKLSGASQDELVLMQMIEDNYESSFVSRDSDSITIKVNKVQEVYDIIKFYEFTSERKMMSITVKRQSDGALLNFAKGADMMIKKKLEEQGKTGFTLFQ